MFATDIFTIPVCKRKLFVVVITFPECFRKIILKKCDDRITKQLLSILGETR